MYGKFQPKDVEQERLRQLVDQWNENRLDLFSLSYPTEDLEIHGVMRFYFQESRDKVSTKCIRVSSTATTRAVIEALVDKFHPDLKMLSDPEYTLWEVHENGEERCLAPSERPLLVQLKWHKDDREGRFLLRMHLPNAALNMRNGDSHNRKRFSKKEGKELKKKHQKAIAQEPKCAAEELYNALPPTTFTRTISNPEVVMKKRREKKIAAKLKDLGQGGSLKIFGYEIEPSRPYVTLLVSVRDRADKILQEALEKYGIDKNVENYVLVELVVPASTKVSRSVNDLRSLNTSQHERIMDHDECPLINLANRTPNPSEEVLFVIKHRPSQMPIRRTRHSSLSSTAALDVGYANPRKLLSGNQILHMQNQFAVKPCLLPLTSNGREVPGMRPIFLPFGVLDIGSDRSTGLFLDGQHVKPRHAVINYQDGVVTITASDPSADVEVNGQRICQTVALRDGNIIGIGRNYLFRYISAWDAEKFTVNVSNEKLCKISEAMTMETTFGINGSTISMLRGENVGLTPRSDHHLSTMTRVHLLGKPLPGLATYMKCKSLSNIELALSEGRDLAITRATSSDVLNRLLTTGSSMNGSNSSTVERPMMKRLFCVADTIPALVEVKEEVEDGFLHGLICPEKEDLQYKLVPAYVVYMVARHRLLFQAHNKTVADSRVRLQLFLTKAANCFHMIAKQACSKESVCFWLVNSSELLNFYKQDVDLSALSYGMPQQILADCVENTFEMLAMMLKNDIDKMLYPIRDASLDDQSATRGLVATLEEIMGLLRHCRLNAALTIQLFSQLFYHISATLFNWLISPAGTPYCSRAFGVRLRTRLGYINEWAFQQGLELAAECHMDRINQAIIVLVTPKTIEHMSNLGATCYKLNSMQVRWLLDHVVLDVGEEPVSRELTESIVRLAETHADVMSAQDGVPVKLEEEPRLRLPFLLPHDGYSPDLLRGLFPFLAEVISALQAQGLCRCYLQNHSSGSWMAHFSKTDISTDNGLKDTDSLKGLQHEKSNGLTMSTSESRPLSSSLHQPQYEPVLLNSVNPSFRSGQNAEIINVNINRGSGSIGLSIVAAQGVGERTVGIYVKKVVNGSAAHRDGRLETGDQLLSVNGHSLIDTTQEEAASKISSSGPIVSFKVYKHAARYNGLYQWLNIPPLRSSTDPVVQTDQQPTSGQHSVTSVMSANVVSNSNYLNAQCFSRQHSPISTTSNYSSQTHFMKPVANGCQTAMTPSAHLAKPQFGYGTIGTEPIKNRSASTSDIYQNQTDTSSMMSLTSLQSRIGASEIPQYERYQANTGNSQRSTMPSYYRNIRPIVIQPSRSAPSPFLRQQQQVQSRSPVHVEITSTSASHYQNVALKNALSSEYVLSSTSSSPITDYANLPLIEDNTAFDSSSPSATFPNQHSFSYTSNQPHFETSRILHTNSPSREENSTASTSSQDSLRSSFVAYNQNSTEIGNEQSRHKRRIFKPPPPLPRKNRTRRDELNDQLDQLESKGAAMTEADRQKYRELVNELAKIRIPLPFPSNLNKCGAGMSTGKEQSKFISPEADTPKKEHSAEIMEKLSVGEKLENKPANLDCEEMKEIVKKTENATIGVQQLEGTFWDNKSSMHAKADEAEIRNEKGIKWGSKDVEDVEQSDSSISKLVYNDDHQLEPRAQVLGTQEIYRDPRQKRLIELEAKQHAAEAKIDGSKLGFRDKMQLFAEQIGEKTLKNRFKTSAVQREIEQSMSH